MKLLKLFDIINAKSQSFKNHEKGNIAFITNGDYDNSILGYVTPLKEDRIFHEYCICVSSFCQAVIHSPPFIARGNGGSGLVVLIPKNSMTKEELFFYAAQINLSSWRFSYGRMVIGSRLQNIELLPFKRKLLDIDKEIDLLLPKEKQNPLFFEDYEFKYFSIKELCEIYKKNYYPIKYLEKGNVPYVTTTASDNGVKEFVKDEPIFGRFGLTIALNGSVGEVFFQVDDFISSSDNAVLYLKDKYQELDPYLLFYIGAVFKIHKWRYNYAHKLKIKELRNLEIPIPFKSDKIDINFIYSILDNTYCWDILKSKMKLKN